MAVPFIDEAIITVSAGKGGNGCLAFRREKHVPRGGPAGGNGGRGGDVILVADPNLETLQDHAYQRHYRAENGAPGGGDCMTGRSGEDCVVPVPPGTLVYDAETGELLGDLDRPGVRLVVARGGRGGRGNAAFVTPTDRAPRKWEPGEPGEVRRLRLELKVLADVGLVGLPNAGKSTFLAAVSRARPKVADYPFTTLRPHLGLVALDLERRFVMADLPGLVEGAAEGRGLGHRFLKHVERTRVLVHLVTLEPEEEPEAVLRKWQALRRELERYQPDLARKPEILVLTKLDLPWVAAARPRIEEVFRARRIRLLAMSAVTGQGVRKVLEAIWKARKESRKQDSAPEGPQATSTF